MRLEKQVKIQSTVLNLIFQFLFGILYSYFLAKMIHVAFWTLIIAQLKLTVIIIGIILILYLIAAAIISVLD